MCVWVEKGSTYTVILSIVDIVDNCDLICVDCYDSNFDAFY